MSWSIPQQIEKDIIAGKARYQTFQTGNGGQSIIDISPNSYVVIFGYDFSPAGGGFKRITEESSPFSSGSESILNNEIIRFFETQQISFYTGTDFYPFIHHVDLRTTQSTSRTQNNVPPAVNSVTATIICEEIDSTPIARQVYITATNSVTITVGLVDVATRAVANAIPITNRTPPTLTYGGSAQVINSQTDFGPGATPLQFIQPSPISFQDFGFGALPGNADSQAFATPNATNGLVDPSFYIRTVLGNPFSDKAACHYYLNVHYALYTAAIPEQRG